MKRNRPSCQTQQTPDLDAALDKLIRLARGLEHACCRSEDRHWEAQLARLIDHLLADNDETTLTAALDHLYKAREPAYEALVDMVENRTEAHHTARANLTHLLFAVPILVWSRFAIPFGSINPRHLDTLRTQLQQQIFAEGAQLTLVNYLYSPDQLPQGYCSTQQLGKQLVQCAAKKQDLQLDPAQFPETASFLSDTRYLLGVVSVAADAALFRWQENHADNQRSDILQRWQTQGSTALRPLLPGCTLELLLPQSYHAACRQAERLSRAFSLRASIGYLGSAMNLAASQLRAIIAPFHGQSLEEYRVGFTRLNSNQVIHGLVWALLDAEDENTDIPAQIETLLRELGVGEVLHIDHRLPVEYCDDCGTPLYPNPEAEAVHLEMPEELFESMPRHLH